MPSARAGLSGRRRRSCPGWSGCRHRRSACAPGPWWLIRSSQPRALSGLAGTMMSQLRLVAGAVVNDAGALGVGVCRTRVPSGTCTIPELLEPAWNAITRPITRPSATGTASWSAICGTPLPCTPRRHADRSPSCTRSTSLPGVPLVGAYVRPARRPDAGNLGDPLTGPAHIKLKSLLSAANVVDGARDRRVIAVG